MESTLHGSRARHSSENGAIWARGFPIRHDRTISLSILSAKRRSGAAYFTVSACSRYAIIRAALPVRSLISRIAIRRCSTSSISRGHRRMCTFATFRHSVKLRRIEWGHAMRYTGYAYSVSRDKMTRSSRKIRGGCFRRHGGEPGRLDYRAAPMAYGRTGVESGLPFIGGVVFGWHQTKFL